MATALAHTELQESQLREQLQAMTASLTESNATAGTAQDQAAQLQQVLTASEHDWKMLQVSFGFIVCIRLQFDNCLTSLTIYKQYPSTKSPTTARQKTSLNNST